RLPDPAAAETFGRSKLDWSDLERRAAVLALHADAIALRRREPALQRQVRGGVDGAVIGASA
ncbi:MAG: Alpha-amylase-family protein, partial [Enterovirga sp.]|nr:Alpha-amylase-family protein [Enterovirga sp.]